MDFLLAYLLHGYLLQHILEENSKTEEKKSS